MFDLYFAGTGSKYSQSLIRECNGNQLLSQLNERSSLSKWVSYLRDNPDYKGKLFVDSGAYTAYTKGAEIDIDDYIDLINEIGDVVTVFAQVDTIPQQIDREPTEEEFSAAAQKSWDNYLYMVQRIDKKYRDKLMPVFHFHEDVKWLKNMLEYTFDDGSHIKYIGLAVSTIDTDMVRYKWLQMCFSIIKKSSNPDVKTHAFGCNAFKVLEKTPLTSADATTWVISAAYGQILFEGKRIFVSDRSYDKPNHFNHQSLEVQKIIKQQIEEFGLTMEELINETDARAKFNILTIMNWQNNYKYTGKVFNKHILF